MYFPNTHKMSTEKPNAIGVYGIGTLTDAPKIQIPKKMMPATFNECSISFINYLFSTLIKRPFLRAFSDAQSRCLIDHATEHEVATSTDATEFICKRRAKLDVLLRTAATAVRLAYIPSWSQRARAEDHARTTSSNRKVAGSKGSVQVGINDTVIHREMTNLRSAVATHLHLICDIAVKRTYGAISRLYEQRTLVRGNISATQSDVYTSESKRGNQNAQTYDKTYNLFHYFNVFIKSLITALCETFFAFAVRSTFFFWAFDTHVTNRTRFSIGNLFIGNTARSVYGYGTVVKTGNVDSLKYGFI